MVGLPRSKAKMYAVEVLYKNNRLFHERLTTLHYTTGTLAKVTFSYLQALKARINGHDEDLETLYQAMEDFLKQTKPEIPKDNNDT